MPGFKVLNVAEKNDAAKNIAGLLSGGARSMREGFSRGMIHKKKKTS